MPQVGPRSSFAPDRTYSAGSRGWSAGDPPLFEEPRSFAPRERAPVHGAPVVSAAASPADGLLTGVLNVSAALLALVFLAPLMIALAVAVYASDGGPVLFAHKRLGKGGRPFYCLKFRSMAIDAEARLAELLASDPAAFAEWRMDHKLRRDPRVTPLGRFLRRSSLDELPQLLNVLRGEMSLVGPRPIVEAEAVRYGRRFRHYCAVKPGITGLWQVSGRNDTAYRSRVAMDCVYARRRSVRLDAVILLMTIPAVLSRQGSY